MRCRGVLLVDQIFGASDEVLPRIVLRQKFPCDWPVFAVLATAPDMRYREDAAALEPSAVLGIGERVARNTARAVSFEKRGLRASDPCAVSAHEVTRSQGLVVAFGL